MRHRLSILASLLLLAAPALAQRIEDAASGIAVTPPAGYSATPSGEPEQGGARAVFDIERTGEADTGCRVSAVSAPGNALLSQAELNARAESAAFHEQVLAALAPRYEILDLSLATSASIVGLVVIGDVRETLGTPGATPVRSLLVFIDTPLQRVFVACVAPRAVFDDRFDDFAAILNWLEVR